MSRLTQKQREVIDDILDMIIPPIFIFAGIRVNRTTVKKTVWTYINADPWINIKLVHTYTKLKRLFEEK